jgi:hypothetical protein
MSIPEDMRLRRPTATQGRAIEVLSRAIECLVDSRLGCWEEFNSPAFQEAIQLLSRANREVFAASPEVVPVGERILRWLMEHLRGYGQEQR